MFPKLKNKGKEVCVWQGLRGGCRVGQSHTVRYKFIGFVMDPVGLALVLAWQSKPIIS